MAWQAELLWSAVERKPHRHHELLRQVPTGEPREL
ncbi:Fatty acid-binding protein, liver [Apodemus speciosus]|uniref:Fatty acid-binding protein, liver n=1 Tax=Apodemus speciosus TaxID=105296 RepID=A0ABQ0EV57_APOSI